MQNILRAVLTTVLATTSALLLTATSALAVVGGTSTSTARHPWMVFLSSDRVGDPDLSGHFCGGALVAPTKVVTAAHCVDDLRPDEFRVIAGRTDLRTAAGDVRAVRDVWFAPKLPAPPGDPRVLPGGDLAVLTLDAPLPQRPIRTIGAGDGRSYRPGTPAMLLGWGVHVEEGLVGPSPVLQSGRFPVIGFEVCDAAFRDHPARPTRLDPRFHVCGGSERGGASGCGGDSGGPLVIGGRLAGVFGPIVSRRGRVCQDAYSGFTRLDVYADLVREQIARP